MLRSALLVIVNPIDSWRYQISSENGGWNTKTSALIEGTPSPFALFRDFLPPPPPSPSPFCAYHAG